MSLHGFASPLVIEPAGALRTSAGILTGLALALEALLALPWSPLPRAAAALGAVLYALAALCRCRPGSPGRITRLELCVGGEIGVGVARLGSPLLRATADRWWSIPGCLIALAVRDERGRQHDIYLYRDRLADVAWRRLLVALRHAPAPTAAGLKPQGLT